MSDIFKDMQVNVGCEYLSDLPSYKRKVWQEMKRLNTADYEERQLEDFSKYVFGMSYQTMFRWYLYEAGRFNEYVLFERWRQSKHGTQDIPQTISVYAT